MDSRLATECDFLGTIVKRRSISGLRLTETSLRRHFRTPKHSYRSGLFGWALKGSYTNGYTRTIQEIQKSRVMFCPGGELHTTSSETGALCFAVELEPAWKERFEEISLPNAPTTFELGSMAALTTRLYQEFNQADKPSILAIEGLVLEMIGLAMRFRLESVELPGWLTQSRSILEETFRGQLTISSIAEQVHVHPVYLASTFRRKYGGSIGDYIRQLRVSYSSRQLVDSGDSLAAIAHDAGFSDQSHFSRIFKRLTGMTPANYRFVSQKNRSLRPTRIH